jgi:type IX secretion system PorP/SprF family membrane protein
MNSRKIIIVLIGVLILSSNSNRLKAQFDAMFTQYMNNEMFINPAVAGAKEALSLTLLHRQQWVGFKGRPVTTTFSANTPVLRSKMGVGISYLNEKIGVMNRNMIYASYAYRVRTGSKSFLSFGLMGGVHLQVKKMEELHIVNVGDPSFSTNMPVVATPNFGFGMYFNTDNFYAGFSIPRMLDDNIKFSPEGIYQKGVYFRLKSFHYYLTCGRLFTISDFFKLKPRLMMKVTANAPVEFDVTLTSLIKEKLWTGLSYRSNADISAIVGLQITPTFLVSYSYDYQLTKIHNFSSGSHEIALSYLFAFRGKKITTPRYF